MGIEVVKLERMTTAEVPLIGLADPDWKDNTWIVSQLRNLADYIESENPEIFDIGLSIDANSKSPKLKITHFNK